MVDLHLNFWSKSCLKTHANSGTLQEGSGVSEKTPKLASLRRIYRSMKNAVSLRGIRKTRLPRPNDTAHAEQLGDNPPKPLIARVCLDPQNMPEPKRFELASNSEADQHVDTPERYLAPPKDDADLEVCVMTEKGFETQPLAVPPINRIPPEVCTFILKYAYPGITNPWGAPLRADQAPLSHRLVNRQFASIIGGLLPALTFKYPCYVTQERLAHLQQVISSQLSAGKPFNSVSIHVPGLAYNDNDASAVYPQRLSLDLWQARLFYATALLIPWAQSVYLDLTELGPIHVQSNPSSVFEQDLSCMRRFFWRSRNRLTNPVHYVTGIPFPFLLPPQDDYSSTRSTLGFQSTDTESWDAQTPQAQDTPFRFPWSQLTEISLDCPMSLDDCVTVLMSCDDRLRSLTLSGVNEGCREPVPTSQCRAKLCDSLQSLSISTFVDIVPFFQCFLFGGLQSLSISLPEPSLFFDFPTLLDFDKFSGVTWCRITNLALLCNFTLESALNLVNMCTSLNSLKWGGEMLAGDSPPVKIISNLASLTVLEYSLNYGGFLNIIMASCSKITSLTAPSLWQNKPISQSWALSHLTLSLPIDVNHCWKILNALALTTAEFSIDPIYQEADDPLVFVSVKRLKSLTFHAKNIQHIIPLLSCFDVHALTSLHIYVECFAEQSWQDLIVMMSTARSFDGLFLNDVHMPLTG